MYTVGEDVHRGQNKVFIFAGESEKQPRREMDAKPEDLKEEFRRG